MIKVRIPEQTNDDEITFAPEVLKTSKGHYAILKAGPFGGSLEAAQCANKMLQCVREDILNCAQMENEND